MKRKQPCRRPPGPGAPRPPLPALLWLLAAAACGPGPEPARVLGPERGEVWTLPTERCGDAFLVEAWINGTGPHPLLLDSGAGSTHLDPGLIRDAGLVSAVDSLRLGPFAAFDFSFRPLEMEPFSLALRREIRGILGHPVFARFTLVYDYPRSQVRVEGRRLDPTDPGVVPGRGRPRPWVRSERMGEVFWTLVDTGSSRGLGLPEFRRLPLEGPSAVTGTRIRVDGIHYVRSGRLQGAARVGPVLLDRPVIHESITDPLVGQAVLRHFEVAFDGPGDRIRFRPAPPGTGFRLSSPPLRGSGYTVRPIAQGYEVLSVFPTSPAHRAGLAVGDTILAVDGAVVADRGCAPPGGSEGGATREEGATREILRVQSGDSVRVLTVAVEDWVP